jgi:F420 biosynthesis protein FbiB-like protein
MKERTAPAAADFWQVVYGRRSIRRYQDRPIDRYVLERVLDAAIRAPSAHNRQPWRFCVLHEGVAKKALADEMAELWRRDLASDGLDQPRIEQRVSISRSRIASAAALVVACLTLEAMEVYPDERRSQAEWTMGVQSVALACQNLLLAAHAVGLGACWMCAPLFAPELVRRSLDLPDAWQPQALIALGYPDEDPVKDREPLQSRVLWR